jgi:hypothetical protein
VGWKPGDPPQGAGRRRRRASASEPPSNVTPIEEAPSAPRRKRRSNSGTSGDERSVTGGSGIAPGRTTGERRETKRIKLGERWSEIVASVNAGEYTWQQFVESLDDEEVARCQLKASDGTFTGRPPAIVPREFALAAGRELKRRFDDIFKKDVTNIAKEYVRLAQDESIPAKDRAKLMQYAMERIFGGIPKELFVTQEAPWEHVVTSIVDSDDQTGRVASQDRYSGQDGEDE